MSDFIPPELVIDVLKRLSVEDLGRCLIVCKSWYSLITNPRFISLHTQNRNSPTNNNNNGLLLVRFWDNLSEEDIYSLRCDDGTFQEYKSLDFPFKTTPNSQFRIIGCSNGVVCLSADLWSHRNTMILWNPSIRKSLTLPKPVWLGCFNHSIGFAFCAATNDFKVVAVFRLDSKYGCDDRVLPPGVEVYDLSVGSWRTVDPKGFTHSVHPQCPQAYLNGVVHWTGRNQNTLDSKFFNMIVSFDMETEEFGEIQMPDSVARDWCLRPEFHVSVLGQSLSLIHRYQLPMGNWYVCDIWVMKQYGEPESWTKLFTIGLGRHPESAFGFLRNGEVLVTDSTSPWNASGRWLGPELAIYDPKSMPVKRLGISGDAKSFYVANFKETLALLLGVQEARSDVKEV